MEKHPLTLDNSDPKVIAARKAEKELFDHYDLQATDYEVMLPGEGIKVRVSVIGNGEPLVIVPGNTGDVFPLAPLLAEFKGRRIIAINRPGGGLSEGVDHTKVDIRKFAVQTLQTVLQSFNLTKVDVVAHSMGAHWSLWLAIDCPQCVRSLTLLGNPGNVMGGRPPLLVRMLARPPLNKVFFKLLTSSDKRKALNLLKFMGHTQQTLNNQPAALGDCYYYFRLLPHYQISLLSLMAKPTPKIDEGQLKQVKQPVLFLLGDNDNFASVTTGEKIAGALPHCGFHVIPGAGHLPWIENPAACGDLIKQFQVNSKPVID